MNRLKREIMVHIPKYKTFKNKVVKEYIVIIIFFLNYIILVKKYRVYVFPCKERETQRSLCITIWVVNACSWRREVLYDCFFRYFKRSAHVR